MFLQKKNAPKGKSLDNRNLYKMNAIRIGTRGSKLALWQAHYIADKLKEAGLTSEVVIIETKGDLILDRTLAKVGSKGIFTEEIEEQLRLKQIDIAVHSAKDLQSELHPDFCIIAFTEREKANDVLVSHHSNLDLNKPVVIGTSSVRRTALFKYYYPELVIKSVRGNLQTRMQKMEAGEADALALAYAGVHRMQYDSFIRHTFTVNQLVPPVGQGTVAVEASRHMPESMIHTIRKAVNHAPTELALTAERAFLKRLQGGCSIPAFAFAQTAGRQLQIGGGIISTDARQLIKKSFSGEAEEAEKLGYALAESVLSEGGAEILKHIRAEQAKSN